MHAALRPLFATLLAASAPVVLGEHGVLMPGEYPTAQVATLPASGWHALVATDAGDRVLAVGLVQDALADDPAWVRVGIGDATADVRFLVRDTRVAAGPVVTVVDAPRQVPQDLPLLMFLGSALPHRIDFDCTDGADDRADCTLVYAHDGRRQALARYAARRDIDGTIELADNAAPAVLWTGDLDRDGALDLLLDLGAGYSESKPTLLLSSARQGDELAGEVARDTRPLALH
jgi:hypothetical protein